MFFFRDVLIEYLGCVGELDFGNNDDVDGEKFVWRFGVLECGDGCVLGIVVLGGW